MSELEPEMDLYFGSFFHLSTSLVCLWVCESYGREVSFEIQLIAYLLVEFLSCSKPYKYNGQFPKSLA